MKKYLNIALAYAIAAMAGGVFYREFTKYSGFTGVTALGKVHAHLFLLGMLVFLVVALYGAHNDLTQIKTFRVFLWVYNIGVPLTAVMLAVRGVVQVRGLALSAAANASISGIAGIGHILTGAGILLLGRPLLGLFTDDAAVLDIGMQIIRLIVPLWFTYLCIEILSGAMRGAGDSLMPTLMTLTGVCLMRVFWVTVVVPRMHQLPVLMMSYPITWVITSCMFIVYYLRGRWLDRCIARQGSVQKP